VFRSEALAGRSSGLMGNVSIVIPVAWQIITCVMLGSLTAALFFLSIATYSRVEIASGTLVPAAGVVPIMPTRGGVITRIAVAEGEEVPRNAMLASIRAEEDSGDGVSVAARVEAALRRENTSLSIQAQEAGAAAHAQLAQLTAQREGLAAEIAQLESQIALQRSLIASSERDLERIRAVADRGFISGRDIIVRQEQLLSRRQALAQLSQSLAARRSSLASAEGNALQLTAEGRGRSASLEATRAELSRQTAEAAGARSYVLRAPVAGRIAALTGRPGQPVNPQTGLMSIIPARSTLQAQLSVPTSAIGFVKRGQVVRLAIDAFPFQRFGTVTGRVITVAATPISQPGPNDTTKSVYPVMVALDRTAIPALGRQEPLVSGMTLTARIITEKQSLLRWLFEPLYAVGNR
jgi:membrane fusion protein